MDARDARRAAEKAARDLINTRAALIGELGVAAARHTDTTTGVTHAHHHAQALLDEARRRGNQLVRDAQTAAEDTAAASAAAYDSATAAGWTPTELDQLGFPAPTPPGRRSRPAAKPASAAAPGVRSIAPHHPTVGTQADAPPTPQRVAS
jgi:hypothetical protein